MWVVAVLLALAAIVTRQLSPGAAGDVLVRVGPVLVFLVAMTVLAELADAAGLFDVAAAHAARLGGGRTRRLYLAMLVLAVATTVVLSLDTTAVLLTPVMLSLAQGLELDPLPFAFATVWLANTASLLLPVSNLTNLLAIGRLDLSPTAYAARLFLPAAAAVVVTCAALLVRHRHALRGRYDVPLRAPAGDRWLLGGAATASLLLVVGLLAGLPAAIASSVAATLLAGLFVVRRPSVLRPRLVPWRLLLLVIGLFLVVAAAGPLGLDDALRAASGHGSRLRLVATAAVGANVANNLPAYLALDRVAPTDRLLDVLVGVNLGPLVLPWGSLATLLWLERCRARGLRIRLRSFALSGLVLVPPLLVAATFALRA